MDKWNNTEKIQNCIENNMVFFYNKNIGRGKLFVQTAEKLTGRIGCKGFACLRDEKAARANNV